MLSCKYSAKLEDGGGGGGHSFKRTTLRPNINVILKPLNIGKTCKNLALYLEHWLRDYLVTLIIFPLTPTHHPPGITYDKKVMLQKGIFDKIFQQLIFNDISALLINEAFPYLKIT